MCCCCPRRQTGLHRLATVKLCLPCSSGPRCSCLQPSLVLLPRLANQRFSHLFPPLGQFGYTEACPPLRSQQVIQFSALPAWVISYLCSSASLGIWHRETLVVS